jgi:hypothetical protein
MATCAALAWRSFGRRGPAALRHSQRAALVPASTTKEPIMG